MHILRPTCTTLVVAAACVAEPVVSQAQDEPHAPPGHAYPGPRPGAALTSVDLENGRLQLFNDILAMSWDVQEKVGLRPRRLADRVSERVIWMDAEAFVIVLEDGSRYAASEMTFMMSPVSELLADDPARPRLAERFRGRRIRLELLSPDQRFYVTWTASMRDESNYMNFEITITPGKDNLHVREIVLLDLPGEQPRRVGDVDGSVVADGTLFFGYEHPMSSNIVVPAGDGEEQRPRVRCSLEQDVRVRHGRAWTQRAVLGVVPEGQLRRGFLHYLERERAHPYRPFLHYNSWYDIGYFTRYDEADCLAVVRTICEQLVHQRGVELRSFLFDDGWDDYARLWKFHDGLPNGFSEVARAAASCGADPGVWLSPWGGYGEPRKQRLQAGQAAGYEVNDRGFALSAPKYYRHVRSTCLRMIRSYGVNQFKFDGVGHGGSAHPNSPFGNDFDAAMHLIDDLREARPDVYINLTTGTWPSPFWLMHADSTWRGGHDHEFMGPGSERQRWITYRDAMTYKNIVQRAPLYPLSSLMLHGVIYARHARGLHSDPGGDLRAEIRSGFGSGTQLQELYITPTLLTPANWDDLAAAARWANDNRHVLPDVRWIGGDPEQGQVYGWAAWAPGKAVLTLRNPGDKPQGIDLDAAAVFDLPTDAPRAYGLGSPYPDQRVADLELEAGRAVGLVLQPFEVLVFDATPRSAAPSQP